MSFSQATSDRQVPDVKVGQIWEDNDSRSKTKRQVKITNVDGDRVWMRNLKTGRTTVASRQRMRPTSTGYKLVEDVAHGDQD